MTTALVGGSSRQDNSWLLILRPVSILCIVTMLLTGRSQSGSVKPIGLLLILFAVTIVLQLVPLPPSVWYGLPGRFEYDSVARALDGTNSWHPLAVAPDLAWNSLVSLLTPLGVLVGFTSLRERERRALLWLILGLVAISAALGVVQVVNGEGSSLYWYDVSGRGQMIGLFANRNHQGALLAAALPLLRAWTLSRRALSPQAARAYTIIGLTCSAIIILYILVLGSRAALVLMVLGLLAAILVNPAIGDDGWSRKKRWIIGGVLMLGIAGLVLLTTFAGRDVTFGRVASNDVTVDGRLLALPTLLHIVARTMPWGTGFGSFVPVYASYEPDELLATSYFNNAHDDLLELAITGGVPALLVLAVFLAWWSRASWRCFFRPAVIGARLTLRRAASFAILILLIASLSDYPLRTPLMAMIFSALCCLLAHDPIAKSDQPPGRRPSTKSHASA